MAFSGSRRRFRKRRFSRPLAHKKLLWCFTSQVLNLNTGIQTNFTLLQPSQWLLNTTGGNFEKAKILSLILCIQSSPSSTQPEAGLFYALSIDDAAVTMPDPSTAAYFAATQPFHWGNLRIPGGTVALAGSAGNTVIYNGFPDNVRRFKVNRTIRSDQNLWASVQPNTNGGANVTPMQMTARILLALD